MKKFIISLIALCSAVSTFATEQTATITDSNQVWYFYMLEYGTKFFVANPQYIIASKNADYVEGTKVYEKTTLTLMEFDLSQFKDVDFSSIKKATLTLTPMDNRNDADVLLCEVKDNSLLTGNSLIDARIKDSKGNLNMPTHYTTVEESEIIGTIIPDGNSKITIDVTDYILSLGSFDGLGYLGFTFLSNGAKQASSSYYGFDANKGAILTLNPAVPEPATYAAIFGALALGFVVWRKRK